MPDTSPPTTLAMLYQIFTDIREIAESSAATKLVEDLKALLQSADRHGGFREHLENLRAVLEEAVADEEDD